jgi:hypothetical protein
MLKLFGTTQCRRCGSTLEHAADESDAAVGGVMRRDSRLVCRSCGFSRPVIYAHVRSISAVQ